MVFIAVSSCSNDDSNGDSNAMQWRRAGLEAAGTGWVCAAPQGATPPPPLSPITNVTMHISPMPLSIYHQRHSAYITNITLHKSFPEDFLLLIYLVTGV